MAFGLMILGSLDAAFSYKGEAVSFGNAELLGTVVYELVVGAIIWLALRSRGWKWSDFSFHYSAGTALVGVGLAVVTLVAWCLLERVLGRVPTDASAHAVVVLALSIVNPLFEELLVLAYVVQSMRKRFGLVTAMNVSIAIRVVYHLYQGPLAVIPIALFGVIVTIAYVRLGRLWPVVLAHGLIDFIALMGWECFDA